MCFFDPRDVVDVKIAISKLVKRKRRFTGHDVHNSASINHVTYSSRDTSAKVRELFNAHDPCFATYACFPIPGGGPLLYFYAGSEVLAKGQGILDQIHDVEATPNS